MRAVLQKEKIVKSVYLLIFLLAIFGLSVAALILLFDNIDRKAETKIAEYHIATELYARSLVEIIVNAKADTLSSHHDEKKHSSLKPTHFGSIEKLENIQYEIKKVVNLISLTNRKFNDPAFSPATSRLKESYLRFEKNFKVMAKSNSKKIVPLFEELLNRSEQLMKLHKRSYRALLEKKRKENYNETNILLVIVLSLSVVLLLVVRIILKQIYSSLEEKVSAREAMENLNANLERIVEIRTRELKDTNCELKKTITNLEKTQEQLIESEKMASLGNLVAGIAHEVNTPLGVGVTAITFLQHECKNLATFYQQGKLTETAFKNFISTSSESCTMLKSNLDRAVDLVKSFKQVAVDRTHEDFRQINMKSYIDQVLQSLHPKLRKTSHEVNLICPSNLECSTNPGALSQILTNLIINSLIHGFENIDCGKITIDVSKSGDRVEIMYKDNGSGVPAHARKKIFEPFFTTRRGKGGSGLGMHIVYNLVTQSLDGTIKLDKEEAYGAVFKIDFPIHHN
ncbi:sensor histidine kinase [Aliikangiella coralliicola]|nr:ATP-binding protein [Aliikangiella coralliicola]